MKTMNTALGSLIVTMLLTQSAVAMYHPRLGRFVQRDPSGPRDGPSLYEYARSRPNAATDPSGLKCCLYIDYDGTMWDFGPLPPNPRGPSPTDLCGASGECGQKNGSPIDPNKCSARIMTGRCLPPNPDFALWGYTKNCNGDCVLTKVCKDVLGKSIGTCSNPFSRRDQWKDKKKEILDRMKTDGCTRNYIIDDNPRIGEDDKNKDGSIDLDGDGVPETTYCKPQDWGQCVRDCCN